VAEWLIAPVLKTGGPLRASEVRPVIRLGARSDDRENIFVATEDGPRKIFFKIVLDISRLSRYNNLSF